MTTLLAWVVYAPTGEKPHLPRGVYIASDSRITWGSHSRRWDAGRKIFSPVHQPHIFGYCGDVIFPSLVLGQIASAIDQGMLFYPRATADVRNIAILGFIRSSHRHRKNAPEQDFTILHLYREAEWPATSYRMWMISYYAKTDMWESSEIPLPSQTSVVVALGSGAAALRRHAAKWSKSNAAGTSRSIFSAFCDAISSGEDQLSGGMPQLSGLYTVGRPRNFGYIEGGQRYFHGLPVERGAALDNIEWFDGLFNRLDPFTLQPAKGARRFFKSR